MIITHGTAKPGEKSLLRVTRGLSDNDIHQMCQDAKIAITLFGDGCGMVESTEEVDGVTHIFPVHEGGRTEEWVAEIVEQMERKRAEG